MKQFSTFLKHSLLGSFLVICSLTHAQDFKIQHIQDDVDNSASTTATITTVSALSSAFVIPGNNKMTHAGRSDSDNGDLEGDDMSGARVLTDTDEITYYRQTSAISNDMNFRTMVWEYTGAASGANEFIVRGRYVATLNGDGTNGEGKTLSTIDISGDSVSNADKCIPFITGILNSDTGNGADSGTAIAYLEDSDNLVVKRGNWDNNVVVYVTLVEFTGSNWTVLHGTSGESGSATGTITLNDGADGTGTTTAVGSWDNSIIFTQSKAQTSIDSGSPRQRINSQWPIIAPGADNETVDWTFDALRQSSSNDSNHFVHILENSEIEVTRYLDTSSADNESTIDISSANLQSEDQAMIIGTSIDSGTNSAYGIGWRNYYLNSTTEAAHWSHRSGNTMSHNIQIIDLYTVRAPGGIIGNLELWLKANDGVEEAASDPAEDGDSVLNWLDNSLNANNATQGTGANQPTYTEAAINFNPTLDFDGANHEMTASGVATGADVTIFAVAEGTYSTTKTLLNLDNGANGSIDIEQTAATTMQGSYTDSNPTTSGTANATITSGTPFLVNYRQQTTGGANRIFINGIQTVGGTPNANTLSGNFTAGIGANPSTSSTRWNGEIAEMIVYNYKVPVTERYRIESYLGIKYGITIGVNGTSQDYVDSDGRVIWDVDTGVPADDAFDYNVTGVGRDDVSGLEQKQSKTINTTDDITVGIKGIETTNQGNTTSYFADKTFLMWGNDNGATTATTDISKDFSAGTASTNTLSATPIVRKWKMVVTDSVPTVKLSIPESMVSSTFSAGEKYVMIVADDVGFTTNVTSATMDDVGTELEVDFYFEGTKYITFGSAAEVSIGSSAAYFDNYGATDTYLDAGDVNDLDNTDFTISAWVRRDSGAEKFDVVSKRNYFDEYIHPTDSLQDKEGNYTSGYAFRINKKGQFRMVWKEPSDTGNYQLQTNETIPGNEWHHIAATYDISTNIAILYIDGIHVYDSDDFLADKGYALDPLTTPSDSHFMIGAAHHIKRQQKVRGSIDEVRVWNVPLSGDQIRYIMNQEIEENGALNADGKLIPSTTTKNEIESIPWNNLIAYYPMSTAVFGSIKDESNSGNDASMINYDNVEQQTAPLPYKTKSGGTGEWDDPDTWENGDKQYLPGVVSYLYESEADADKITMDYNIVQIDDNVTISNSDTDLIPTYKNNVRTLLGLIVNSGKDLEVDADNAITISHYLKVDGTIDLEGESQLIQTTYSDLDPTSSGTLERDQQGVADTYTYNYWSSPVGESNISSNNNSFTVPDILSDGTTASSPAAINFLTSGYDGSSSPFSIADYWIWKFANAENGNYSLWQHMRSNGTIKAGEGYTMKGPGSGPITANQNYVFNGKPNNGDITLVIGADNNYLVGNPYPSAISATTFINDNPDTNGTLYFWEHWGGGSHYLVDYQGGYGQRNLGGGTPAPSHPDLIDQTGSSTKTPGEFIPVSQGFFVYSSGGGNINFENDQRVFEKDDASGDNSVFMKSASNATTNTQYKDNRMKLRIGFDSFNGIHRQLLLTKDDNATSGVDWGYDGNHRGTQIDDMYWVIEDEKFIIQGTNVVNAESVFPLGIKVRDNGHNSISIDQLENVPDNLDIYFYDNELNIYHDIRQSDYQVYLTTGEYLDRFAIVFGAAPDTLGTINNELNKVLEIFFNNESDNIIIINPTLLEIESFELFNILGQSIFFSNDIETEDYSEIKIHNLSSGTYIINIDTIDGKISKKVLVN